jgi:hypothetical protein
VGEAGAPLPRPTGIIRPPRRQKTAHLPAPCPHEGSFTRHTEPALSICCLRPSITHCGSTQP